MPFENTTGYLPCSILIFEEDHSHVAMGQYFQKLLLPNFPDFPDFRQLIAFFLTAILKPILSRWEATFASSPFTLASSSVSGAAYLSASWDTLATRFWPVASTLSPMVFSSMASHLSSITSVFGLFRLRSICRFFRGRRHPGPCPSPLFLFFQLLNVIGKREPFFAKLQFFGHVRPFFHSLISSFTAFYPLSACRPPGRHPHPRFCRFAGAKEDHRLKVLSSSMPSSSIFMASRSACILSSIC